ncbi:discoidin domain-containing protein [Methylocystis bryophila]|nr:discoidin domain-containing protein [Methylocystis bryophila]
MKVPPKSLWKATASSGDARRAIDDCYATAWASEPSKKARLEIDLGRTATLGGLEVYWGGQAASEYGFETSLDGRSWSHLCSTRHGEGGQDVFAFPPVAARFLRWSCETPTEARPPEIVQINLYDPADAASVLEGGRVAALGHAPIALLAGESITVDFGYVRSPLGALVEWGERFGVVFSVHLSDDGENFREVGRMTTGDGGTDSFWWRSTTSRYFRLSLHAASAPEGAIVKELKLRILNKDRMPIGQLERAARKGRADLYPQSLLGRQVYWTVLGELNQDGEALFDEYGNLEAQRGFAQLMPLLRLGDGLHGAPASETVSQCLVEGSLPIPNVVWSTQGLELHATALAHEEQAMVEYRIANRGDARREGALVLTVRPVQINPYWQHGGHALVNAISVEGVNMRINDSHYAAFSREPDVVTIADFEGGDVLRLLEHGPQPTTRNLRSDSGLLSAACEFAFSLDPGEDVAVVAASPLSAEIAPHAEAAFSALRNTVAGLWRNKLGARRITVGDQEISDTIEAQIALILVNATRFAFRPGPRNYDRIWIRDGSSQALALLWAGLIEEAKSYVVWYSKRIYENGLAPPILNPDGTVNRGYGSDIEYDAQGEFVGVAAEVYRVSKDRVFLDAVFEPVVRATQFIEALCAKTDARRERDSRCCGLVAPSISHEGYSKPSYSYWDDFFALSAWRNCEYLAREAGELEIAEQARAKGRAFAETLARSLRVTSELMGRGLIAASADREDVDPSSTAIAFEPCRVEDVLPAEFVEATFDLVAAQIEQFSGPAFEGNYSPYLLRNLNAFASLGRRDDAFRLLAAMLACRRPAGWRQWAEVVWSDPRAPEYIGDMPHSWIGAEFATAMRRMLVREDGGTLELFRAVPESWWEGEGIRLRDLPTAFGALNLKAQRGEGRVTVELALSGPAPDRITFRYAGAICAQADGRSCQLERDLIVSKSFSRLTIAF